MDQDKRQVWWWCAPWAHMVSLARLVLKSGNRRNPYHTIIRNSTLPLRIFHGISDVRIDS
jgi:hypothetical protein